MFCWSKRTRVCFSYSLGALLSCWFKLSDARSWLCFCWLRGKTWASRQTCAGARASLLRWKMERNSYSPLTKMRPARISAVIRKNCWKIYSWITLSTRSSVATWRNLSIHSSSIRRSGSNGSVCWRTWACCTTTTLCRTPWTCSRCLTARSTRFRSTRMATPRDTTPSASSTPSRRPSSGAWQGQTTKPGSRPSCSCRALQKTSAKSSRSTRRSVSPKSPGAWASNWLEKNEKWSNN